MISNWRKMMLWYQQWFFTSEIKLNTYLASRCITSGKIKENGMPNAPLSHRLLSSTFHICPLGRPHSFYVTYQQYLRCCIFEGQPRSAFTFVTHFFLINLSRSSIFSPWKVSLAYSQRIILFKVNLWTRECLGCCPGYRPLCIFCWNKESVFNLRSNDQRGKVLPNY